MVDDAALIGLLEQGRWDTAAVAAKERIGAAPDAIVPVFVLATALRESGAAGLALEWYERLASLQPTDWAHWHNLAALKRDLGDRAGAEQAYAQALRLAPAEPMLLLDAGLLALEDGHLTCARERLCKAVERAPAWPMPRLFLARCHAELCDDEAVRDSLASCAVEALPGELLIELGSLYAQIGDTEQARLAWERSLAFPAHRPRASALLASLHERLNQITQAESHLASLPPWDRIADPALRQDVLQASAVLAARRQDLDAACAHYRALLADSLSPATRARVGFDLGRLLVERPGREAEAMQVLREAHAVQVDLLSRAMPEFSKRQPEPLTLGLEVPMLPPATGPEPAMPAPVFVVGFPRSGTTLLEQMLDAVPTLASMDERTFVHDAIEDMQRLFGLEYPAGLERLDPPMLDQLRSGYMERVAQVRPLAPDVRLVDKNPLNIMRLPMMLRLFPHARFILALRHPCDVLLSCYMQNFRSPVFQYLCRDLPSIALAYDNAMRGWVRGVDLLRPTNMVVRYEDLLDDPAGTARRLADFVGSADTDSMLGYHAHAQAKGYISTPSYAQVVQPLTRSAAGRWQRFAPAFEKALPTLRPWLERWGYSA